MQCVHDNNMNCLINRTASLVRQTGLSKCLTPSRITGPLYLKILKTKDFYKFDTSNYRKFHRSSAFQQEKVAQNYYDVLEITPNASRTQIKSAYYKLSKQYHPDVSPSSDAHKKFAEISEAYEVLGNPRSRRAYNRKVFDRRHDGRRSTTGSDTIEMDTSYNEFLHKKGKFKSRDKSGPHTGRTQHYNYDEFYEKHYEKMRPKPKNLSFEEQMLEKRLDASTNRAFLTIILCLIGFGLVYRKF